MHLSYTDIDGPEEFGMDMRVNAMDHLRRPMTGKGLPGQDATLSDAFSDCGMPEVVNSEPWRAGLLRQSLVC